MDDQHGYRGWDLWAEQRRVGTHIVHQWNEDALKVVPGVQAVQVSAASHRGRIVWSSGVTQPSRWMAAAQRAGYPAVPANDVFASDRRRAETRLALWRWLVACLCMMQVMMYAWPVYVATPGDITPDMVGLLRWARLGEAGAPASTELGGEPTRVYAGS